MEKLTAKISDILVQNKNVSSNDRAVCAYGLEVFLTTFLEIGFILLVSAFVGNFIETLIFFVGFLPIRSFAGSYHADTRIRCFCVLVFVYALFLLITYIGIRPRVYKLMVILTPIINLVCVYKWAPLRHKNKRINKDATWKFKKFALLLSVAEGSILYLLLTANLCNKYTVALLLGLLTALFSLIAGVIKNKIIGREV